MEGKLLAKNKKAYFDYEIVEKYETGIVLTGPEVKSIKASHVQLKGSYATLVQGKNRRLKIVTSNLHVSPYRYSIISGYDPLRRRELLLRRKEIDHLAGLTTQKGFTLIPLEIVLKNNLIKVLLGVCRGKASHDKRQLLKKRAITRDIEEGLKKFTR